MYNVTRASFTFVARFLCEQQVTLPAPLRFAVCRKGFRGRIHAVANALTRRGLVCAQSGGLGRNNVICTGRGPVYTFPTLQELRSSVHSRLRCSNSYRLLLVYLNACHSDGGDVETQYSFSSFILLL